MSWREVVCEKAPFVPLGSAKTLQPGLGPAKTPHPENVGYGTDFNAHSDGSFSTAVGSFQSIFGLASETDNTWGPNEFSLQLNTNPFNSPAFNCPSQAGCHGWEQFALMNDPATNSAWVLIQYWLLGYIGQCPEKWLADTGGCFFNSPSINGAMNSGAPLALSDLAHASLRGTVNPGGMDVVTFSSTGSDLSAIGMNSLLGLNLEWHWAEFNLFGFSSFSEAVISPETTITVMLNVTDGTTDAPGCGSQGFTGESNSLNLINPCCPIGGQSPAIMFTESNAETATSVCACSGGATWDTVSAACVCEVPGQFSVNGQCAGNQCGGKTNNLGHVVGDSCGQPCAKWTCDGPNAVTCVSFATACGVCGKVPQKPGVGHQPGEACACNNEAKGHYICTEAKVLSCDCLP